MTKQEYLDYCNRVQSFMDREDIDCLNKTDSQTEPEFSGQSCDCCGTRLAGDRYNCCGYNQTTNQIQYDYSICPDCLYFATYRQLDDMTMLDIEDSE